MENQSDEALIEMLAKIGRATAPSPEGLHRAVAGNAPRPLFITTNVFMTMYSKAAIALAVVLVVLGGVYVALPGRSEVAVAPGGDAMVSIVPASPTGSVDDFATALDGELAAETDGLAAFDAAVAADIAVLDGLTNTSDFSYVDSI
jgi:hypothetical protein